MEKLYIISVGGSKKVANIEIHDVMFVVAETFEETFEALKENWYGEGLHVDSYLALKGADGYQITLKETPSESHLNLYFVFMGGYKDEVFGELHEIGLFVAETEEAAKAKAKEKLLEGAKQKHVDELRVVAGRMLVVGEKKWYIHLTQSQEQFDLKPDWNGYLKLVNRAV